MATSESEVRPLPSGGCLAMLREVLDFYGLERDLKAAGFFETRAASPAHKTEPPMLLSGKVAATTGTVESCLDLEHGRR